MAHINSNAPSKTEMRPLKENIPRSNEAKIITGTSNLINSYLTFNGEIILHNPRIKRKLNIR